MLEGARILVTGGSGLLGSNLVRLLVSEAGARPADIRVLFRPGDSLRGLAGVEGLELLAADVADARAVEAATGGRDLVFHLAGLASLDRRDLGRQWIANVLGSRNVLEAAARSGRVRRLIYAGSVNVLGRPAPGAEAELADPYASRPRMHSFASAAEALALADATVEGGGVPRAVLRLRVGYHDSKLAALELVERASREGRVDAVSVLPGTFFGPRGSEAGSGAYIAAVAGGRLPGVIALRLPLMHVEDAARGLLLAAERGVAGRRYVVTGRDEDLLPLSAMASVIAEEARLLLGSRPVPGLARAPRDRYPEVPRALAWVAAAASEAWAAASGGPCALGFAALRAAAWDGAYGHARASRELGYEPRRSFREGAREALEWLYPSAARETT